MTIAEALRALSLGTVTAIAAACDLRFRRIPDFAIACGLIIEVSLAASLARSLWGGLLGYAVFCIVRCTSGYRLGRGDVKYSLYLGVALGASGWWCATLFASCVALLFATLGPDRQRTRGGSLPFAPFLSGGALFSEGIQFIFSILRGSRL